MPFGVHGDNAAGMAATTKYRELRNMIPPTIELDGARLRPLRAADAAALCAYLREPAVTELTSYPEVSLPLAEGIIERARSRWAAGELSKWGIALQQNDQLIGTCGFNEWSQAHRWAELAYDLAQPHWGQGLMRQAVAAVLQWTYRQDLVDRVVDARNAHWLLAASAMPKLRLDARRSIR